MKQYFFTALLAFAVLPAVAFAQDSPMPPGPAPSGAPPFAAMRAMRGQMMAIHSAARTQMLAALSPAHRALLETLAGQLAVAASPDPKAAIAKLDAALTPAESQAILAAGAAARQKSRALMEQMRANYPPPSGQAPRPHRSFKPHTPDAGAEVFMTALSGIGPGRGGWGPPGMGPGGPGGPGGPPPSGHQ